MLSIVRSFFRLFAGLLGMSTPSSSERTVKGLNWNHGTVFTALVAAGRNRKVGSRDVYVVLYDQKQNCAVLYDEKSAYSPSPLHLNPTVGVPPWREDVFHAIEPFIADQSRSEPANGWHRYRVIDWDGLAKALGL